MKKLILILLFAGYSLLSCAQQPNTTRLSQTKTTATASRLIASARAIFDGTNMVPNDSVRLSYTKPYGWDTVVNTWKYKHADMYEYNNGSYDLFYRIDRTFNTAGQITQTEATVWNHVSNAWLADAKDRFYYTPAGKIDTAFTAHFNGVYWDSTREIVTYNTQGHHTLTLTQEWNHNSSSWEDLARTGYTYSGNNVSETITEVRSGNNWINDVRTIYGYTNGNNTTVEVQNWNGTTWTNNFKWTHTYNSQNEQATSLRQIYNGTSYINQFEINRTFNTFHQKTMETRRSWNVATASFSYAAGDYREYYYYETYTTAIVNYQKAGDFSVYPIPAKEMIYVTLPYDNLIQLTLQDMQGRTFSCPTTKAGAYTYHIATGKLQTGIYLLHIYTEDEHSVQKISIAL